MTVSGRTARGWAGAVLPWMLAAGCGPAGGGPDVADADADREAADAEDVPGETAESAGDVCTTETICLPLAWSCDEAGVPLECLETGEGWRPRAACAAGQHCDPATGWCECGACEVPAADGCLPVGARCADGWEQDGECGCTPALGLGGTSEDHGCPPGELALIGGGCLPVGARDDCGDGTWGRIETDAETLYVDAAYAAGDGDGSRERPFPTLAQAVAAVPGTSAGPRRIAVAAGTYVESVDADRAVRLLGRCPAMTVVAPPAGSPFGVRLSVAGSSLESLQVRATDAAAGVRLESAAGLEVRNVVVRGGAEAAVVLAGAEAALRGCSLAGQGAGAGGPGDALHAAPAPGGESCRLEMAGSVAGGEAVTGAALVVADCDVVLDANRVYAAGLGIRIEPGTRPVAVELTRNSVGPVVGLGIQVGSWSDSAQAEVRLERNRVGEVADNRVGVSWGLRVHPTLAAVQVRENLVVGARTGVQVIGLGAVELLGNRIEEAGIAALILSASASTPATVADNTVVHAGGLGFRSDAAAGLDFRHNALQVDLAEATDERSTVLHLYDGRDCVFEANRLVGDERFFAGLLSERAVGTAVVRDNLVEGTPMGVYFYRTDAGLQLEAVRNRLLNGAVKILVSPAPSVRLEDNAIGPVPAYPVAPPIGETTALDLVRVGTAVVARNRVAFEPSALPAEWRSGCTVLEGSAEITGNRIAGAGEIGIVALHGLTTGTFEIADNVVLGGSGVGVLVGSAPGTTHDEIRGNSVAGVGADPWPTGAAFGDGIAVLASGPDATAVVAGNRLYGNLRTGFFAAGARLDARENRIRGNTISMAWQDGAAVSTRDNEVSCNGSDQPWVDRGLAVPVPPAAPELPAP